MGEHTVLLVIIAAFVLVSAVALCIQAVYLMGVYKTAKSLEQKVVPLVPKIESLVDVTRATVEQTRVQIAEIATKTTEILDSARSQMAKLEDVVSDATSRAKVQMERVELILDDTMSRLHETIAVLHNGVMRPLRQLNSISVAIRAVFRHLLGGRRPSVNQATSDEEMFI
jgi:biopolymer transport protein ExbB/TolQ